MRPYWLICAAVLLVAAPASANGAMGLALATFEWPLWLTYVAVTIILEAVLFGVCLRVSAIRAICLSIAANALTGLVGGYLSGIPSYAFQGVFGTLTNPNPFGRILLLFTLSAVLSAWMEAKVWSAGLKGVDHPPTSPRAMTVSLAVHLLTLPIGLAILLCPDRPYPGLEQQTHWYRELELRDEVQKAALTYLSRERSIPQAHSAEEFLRVLQTEADMQKVRQAWVLAYLPEYTRFSTSERRLRPFEWNAKARLPTEYAEKPVWLIRAAEEYEGHRYVRGLVVDPGGYVRWSRKFEDFDLPPRSGSGNGTVRGTVAEGLVR